MTEMDLYLSQQKADSLFRDVPSSSRSVEVGNAVRWYADQGVLQWR